MRLQAELGVFGTRSVQGYSLLYRKRNFISHSFVKVYDVYACYIDAEFKTVWLLQLWAVEGEGLKSTLVHF